MSEFVTSLFYISPRAARELPSETLVSNKQNKTKKQPKKGGERKKKNRKEKPNKHPPKKGGGFVWLNIIFLINLQKIIRID